jgi:phenylalanyl-tRNA synthetase beta chain
MKISYNWIKEYLKIDLEPEKIAKILTGIGLEIEDSYEWVSVKGGLEGIVIGEVLTCEKHPDADKLSVTTVNIGAQEPLHIVCGAPNVAAGQKVAVATLGTKLYNGNESFEIKKAKIRGIISEGMICAEDEIGLGNSHDGIMILDKNTQPGTAASSYFNIKKDYIFEIGLTPNRIDSGSHFGVARDLAAYLNVNGGINTRAIQPKIDGFRYGNGEKTFDVIVENGIDCPRYSAIIINDVKISESPEWLKNRLKSVGLNPINNVVDITNFVQLEIGQPLHSFDADKIDGKKVIIRNLPDKSKFVTLDGVERSLSSRDLIICNINEGMCIAGVFGGIKSGITNDTKNIFLESAYFNPVSIRKTSKRHGLKTDASFRFERGTDPNITTWALKRATMLISELAGGKISSNMVDIYPSVIQNATVSISYKNVDRLIGKHIEEQTIKKILHLLDIEILKEDSGNLLLSIPTYRVDVKGEADVIEEILRIYDYNNIEIGNHINSTLSYQEKPNKEKVVNTISDMLSTSGFSEIMCNSLNPSVWYEQNIDFDNEKLVLLANPLSSDLNAMRQSLLFGGLSSIIWNINRQNLDLKFYEFGNCYFLNNKKQKDHVVSDFTEKMSLDLFITGNTGRQSWNSKTQINDFFNIKSYIEMILSRVGVRPESMSNGESDKKYFSESLTYSIYKDVIAETGRLSKNFLSKFDIVQDVYYGHIEWDLLLKCIDKKPVSFVELPKFPSSRRDLALLLDKSVKFSQIRDIAFRTEKNILKEVTLFDVYESDSLGENKKSYAVSFILRDDDKTLTDKNIDKVMNNLINIFRKEINAVIR